MADDTLKDQIIKRLAVAAELTPGCEWGDLADAVLTVVEAHTRAAQAQVAAHALRSAAHSIERDGSAVTRADIVRRWLRFRADELDPRPEEEL